MGTLRPDGAFEGRQDSGSGKESENILDKEWVSTEEQRQKYAWQGLWLAWRMEGGEQLEEGMGRLGSHFGDLFTPAEVSAQHTCASAWNSLLTGPLDAVICLVPLGAGPSKGL